MPMPPSLGEYLATRIARADCDRVIQQELCRIDPARAFEFAKTLPGTPLIWQLLEQRVGRARSRAPQRMPH
jgi:hypothetical protein